MAQEIEIHRMPVISTGHLTEEVAKQLTTDGGMKHRWCSCAPWTFGYFIHLDEPDEDAPQCLKDIRAWMLKHSIRGGWVLLDQDAEQMEDLPTYDW